MEQWWSYALGAKQTLITGGEIDNLKSVILFDKFREVKFSLGGNLKTERDDALDAARANSTAREAQIIIAAFGALLPMFIFGK